MQNIKTILNQIETKKQIKILYACETGSRAWGFPSPDSDYDIRFVYMHQRDWYLGLNQRKDTIEIMDGEGGIKKWTEKAAGKDFKFCPKMYQGVTHRGSLANKQFISNEFFRGIVAFEQNLGPIFVQVSDTFSPKRKEELFAYLKTLPIDLQFFLEVRHPDWFKKDDIREEMLSTLNALNMGAVITDTAGRRDCAHMHLTIPKAFIRYVGNSLHPSDYTRCDAWVERMKYWLDHGLEELYFFMHMHDEATSPELTVYLIDKMNAELGLNLIKPTFVQQQKGLFD